MAIDTLLQRENLAIAYGQAAAWGSLHTADPGSTGANEVAGGLYARLALTWTPGGTDGNISVTVTFDAPNGTVVTHIGVWTAASGGSFLDGQVGAAPATSNGQVQATFNVAVT